MNFWCVSGGMPDTDDLDQPCLIIETVNDPIGRNDDLMQILPVKFRNDSPHERMIIKHLDSGNDPVSEMFSPLRAVFCNIFYKAA